MPCSRAWLFVDGWEGDPQCLVTLLGYQMLGLFPGDMLLTWGLVGLVQLVVGVLVGGWIYSEG